MKATLRKDNPRYEIATANSNRKKKRERDREKIYIKREMSYMLKRGAAMNKPFVRTFFSR